MSNPSHRRDWIPGIRTGLFGLLGLCAATAMLSTVAAGLQPKYGALLAAALTALPMIVYEFAAGRGLDKPIRPPEYRRCALKMLGLFGTLGLAAFAYWLLPVYRSDFYAPFFELCAVLAPAALLLAYPYMLFVDRRMADPLDGYWHAGLLMALRWKDADIPALRSHLAGWAVKAFFLPLMTVFLINDVCYLQTHPLELSSFRAFFGWAHHFLFLVDLAFAAVGYSLTLRLFNAHIRTTEPTLLGWASALVCYQPFWGSLQRLYFDYRDETTWGVWLADHPVAYGLWGWLILAALSVYSLSTVCFGLRFSNLTHRGIIGFGPYYFTKHPAYVCKMAHHFLVSVPFVITTGWLDAGRQCVLFGLVAAIYFIRARTEERHLSWDPAYREYAEAVRQRHRKWVRALFWVRPSIPARELAPTVSSSR